ncbi:hypothetical protein N7519_000455 [Penicillium mononematosum]|uniref:uncharacterized protein n=1 Tax=Penicillium mononematosum TaxID=268346 RepID=UPI0025467E61|nr:uncharacterized protein N7519_000455 [Penicillium mononematosum]KAJ6190434.1 hypothetical protein N7519_000455 [Penicillium mononematosum]
MIMLSVATLHCLDILRRSSCALWTVECWAKIWIYPTEPYVDFNTQHPCNNFEAIRRWAEENKLPQDLPADFLQLPNL